MRHLYLGPGKMRANFGRLNAFYNHTLRGTFYLYLTPFAVPRFVLFFVRGNVPVVAFGLKNAQWTALAILAVSVPALIRRIGPHKPLTA